MDPKSAADAKTLYIILIQEKQNPKILRMLEENF